MTGAMLSSLPRWPLPRGLEGRNRPFIIADGRVARHPLPRRQEPHTDRERAGLVLRPRDGDQPSANSSRWLSTAGASLSGPITRSRSGSRPPAGTPAASAAANPAPSAAKSRLARAAAKPMNWSRRIGIALALVTALRRSLGTPPKGRAEVLGPGAIVARSWVLQPEPRRTRTASVR